VDCDVKVQVELQRSAGVSLAIVPAYVDTNAIPQQAFSTIIPTWYTTVVVVVVVSSDESFVLLGQL
jgi:hypothetical protein